MKNDISFVLDTKLSLYEHQSTVNRNMPLRDLMYVAKVFEGLVIHKDLYSSKLIPLPSPRFITFYNGLEEQPERREYHLSDAYEGKDMNLAEAVEKAVDECIIQDVLLEFLLKNKAQVTSMSIFEFDQELHNRTLYEEGREDGEESEKISSRI